MLIGKFIRLVEDHADQLTKTWIKEVRSNPSTKNYRDFSDEVLGKRIYDVYKRLGNWLLNDDPADKKTAEHFMNLGYERAAEGFKVSEVIYALILSRVTLCRFVDTHGLINSPLEIQKAQEFTRRVTAFFDKATYFVALGYESSHTKEHDKTKKGEHIEKAIGSITKWIIKERQV